MDQHAPIRLGEFELVRELGRGGQGVVYLARDARLGRDVAIKWLDRETVAERRSIGPASTEARALALGAVDGVCKLFDVGEHDGHPYLVMQFANGQALGEWMRARGGSEPRLDADVARVFIELARTVDRLHRRGVVHRDLKPSNVIIESSGRPVLIDMGVALLEGERSSSSATPQAGTPAYMAPEQVHSMFGAIDSRTDVWALGAMLCEAVVGAHPFRGPTTWSVCRAIMTQAPDFGAAPIARDLRNVLAKALEKDKSDRYASATEFADDVERLARREPSLARRPSAARRARVWWRRNQRVAMSTAGVATVLFVAAAAAVSFATESERSAATQRRESDRFEIASLISVGRHPPWARLPDGVAAMDAWLSSTDDLSQRESWHRDALATLQAQSKTDAFSLQEIEQERTYLERVIELHGLAGGVRAARSEALDMERRTITEHREMWQRAIDEIADASLCPQYGGLRIRPQVGLIPLGRDPNSGLYEFGHPQTGTLPVRDSATGKLAINESTALVFVLIPGGTATIGAMRPDAEHPEGSPFVDPDAMRSESPVHSVELGPFLLSKYELTRGQAARAFGRDSTLLGMGGDSQPDISDLHPVSVANWTQLSELLPLLGLTMPTEVQWEYAARAGTTSPWWTGWNAATVEGACNFADKTQRANSGTEGPRPSDRERDPVATTIDDHFVWLAPVGSFRPNAFGLHDVMGNVAEWTLDRFASYDTPARPGDGTRLGGQDSLRVFRGADERASTFALRVALRRESPPEFAVGVRPARVIDGLEWTPQQAKR